MSMKKFTTLCLAAAVVSTAFAQQPTTPTKSRLTAEQLSKRVTFDETLAQRHRVLAQESIVKAQQISNGTPNYAVNGKTTAVSAIPLGSASNVYSIVTTEQNQVYSHNDLDLVTFIHRNDLNTFGGSSGHIRYDVSIDGGLSFNNDIGEMNPALTRPARYPNVTGHVPPGTTNPLDALLVYIAPTLDPQPDFDGHVAGVSSIVTSGAPTTTTETYYNLGIDSYLPAGLCQGLPGEYWCVDRDYDAPALSPIGEFFINKGTWNTVTNDVDWVRHDTIYPDHSTSFDGAAKITGTNISFSPDGQTGWIAWLGDLNGQTDSTFMPVFMKSTDGGETWGAPVEFNLNTIPWIYDTIRAFWTDSTNAPASSGRATTAFDCDLVVDNQGNPHLAVVIGSGSTTLDNTPGYSIVPNTVKFMADVWTPDGGLTWEVAYLSPVLCFRGEFGTGDPVPMDNNPQIARNPLGNLIFYSWVDSDTAAVTGNMAGIGFGESDNIAPNLRTVARKPYTNEQTYPKLITDLDLIWDGKALFPTMSPVVLFDSSEWRMPIVMVEMITNDPLAQCRFHYFGNDATFDGTGWCDAASMTINWDAILAGGVLPCTVANDEVDGANSVVLSQSYPNPTANEAYIVFELPAAAGVTMNLTNLYGQTVGNLVNGDLPAGIHKVTVDTRELAAGVYFYTLESNGVSQTKKMIVSK